jgi:hypothetical protein
VFVEEEKEDELAAEFDAIAYDSPAWSKVMQHPALAPAPQTSTPVVNNFYYGAAQPPDRQLNNQFDTLHP